MSEHLWMYEGFTEYFAQHFQVHEGLVSEDQFFGTMMDKINGSKAYDDELSFTKMSIATHPPLLCIGKSRVYHRR